MSRPSTVSSAPFVRYSCARWIGFRVWKPTTRRQPRSSKALRVSAGSRASSGNGGLRAHEDRDLAGEIERVLRVEARDSGMRLVGRPEAALGLALLVVLEDLLDLEDGQRSSAAVGERDAVPCGRGLDGEADRERPGEPVREVHVLDDALVVVAAHESLERRERSRGEHVQVGHLTRGQRQRLEGIEITRPLAGAVDERPTMRRDQRLRNSLLQSIFGHAGTSTGSRPSRSSSPTTNAALSSGLCASVSSTISGAEGSSYGSETPVNSLISPLKAFS